jgi:uncharacterized protein YdeI (YjbR/CyaY-like superfamily)
MKTDHVKPRYFRSAGEFRKWLERNHDKVDELWVGLYKKASGKKGITYKEAVDEALCFGWIDGLVKGVDEDSYMQRFTPRRPRSIWSAVNIKRIQELMEERRLHPAGKKAFLERDPSRAGLYSFENQPQSLPKDQEKRFRADRQAWAFFEAQPPGYRRTAIWWVVSAKRDETKERRLLQLIEDSAAGRRLKHLAPTPKK